MKGLITRTNGGENTVRKRTHTTVYSPATHTVHMLAHSFHDGFITGDKAYDGKSLASI